MMPRKLTTTPDNDEISMEISEGNWCWRFLGFFPQWLSGGKMSVTMIDSALSSRDVREIVISRRLSESLGIPNFSVILFVFLRDVEGASCNYSRDNAANKETCGAVTRCVRGWMWTFFGRNYSRNMEGFGRNLFSMLNLEEIRDEQNEFYWY